MRRTKIVATIGPASDTEEAIGKLISAGMNVARINFSHGTPEYARSLIRRLKKVRERMGRPVAILQDLQGPKIRVGGIAGGAVSLAAGQQYILTTTPIEGDGGRVGVSLKSLPEALSRGHSILLADGAIELQVERVNPPDIYCRVVVGGILGSHKGINLPGSKLQVDSLTRKDRQDVKLGLEEGVDAIALSFVRTAKDIDVIRRVVTRHGVHVPIVAKIEQHEAMLDIDKIVAASDAIMVARGDLGVEIDLERVPLVQKEIIRKCNAVGKPVITATQMLVRMVDNPRPTRAEAADVANAVLDGTDAVMLSEETAVGHYPVESVRIMDRIVRMAETNLDVAKFEQIPEVKTVGDSISRSSYYIAKEIGAAAILTTTWSGSTANRVARFRPKQPILAATPNTNTFHFLSLAWGVTPVTVSASETADDLIVSAIAAAREAGHVHRGQQVVVTGGIPLYVAGNTNFIKVETVR
ncbi:MAG TPA: pyruvate kinase [Terriglobia bacterium]|nr:pyruvate kinase [Terriglobia bacterium]